MKYLLDFIRRFPCLGRVLGRAKRLFRRQAHESMTSALGVINTLRFYLVTLLAFLLQKLAFLVLCSDGASVSGTDMLAVLTHGLTLDLSTALYFVAFPLIVTAVGVWIAGRWQHRVLKVYAVVVAIVLALAFVADIALYPYWGMKLSSACLTYLDQPGGLLNSVTWWQLVGAIAAWAVLSFLLAVALSPAKGEKPSGGASRCTLTSKLIKTVLFVLLAALMVIGIRGGLGESSTNVGQAFFSQRQFLNHAAVNPVFNFFYTLNHGTDALSQYHFYERDDEAQRLAQTIYTTSSIDVDTLLNTRRPDILIILMEGAGEEFADVMPRLQQLKREGVSFTRCYANSWRTDRGTVCALSGYPSFPTLSVMKMGDKCGTLPSVARTLLANGYNTCYLYGGDINFTNMHGYLVSTGWQQTVGMGGFTLQEQQTAKWGVRDDLTFQRLFDMMVNEEGGGSTSGHLPAAHRLFGFSTLSSHEPWDVPVHLMDDKVLNAFAYLDDCIGNFVERLKQTPLWNNLLIVLTPDHGINYGDITSQTPLEKNHIPMLWIGGAIRQPRTVDVICNQSDLPATLLGQLGLPHDDFTFSRDVLSASYTYPTAVHNYNHAQWLCDSTGHVLYDLDAQRVLLGEGSDQQRLLQLSKAILQNAARDLETR